MYMNVIYNKIRYIRQRIGISQVKLSHESGVSLPTIQNIEAGKGNPALETLEALVECLGMCIQMDCSEVNWQALIACGLPLMPLATEKTSSIKPSLRVLVCELRRVIHRNISEREFDAICALLWAIKDHYPTTFASEFKGEGFGKFSESFGDGRLIKLRRNALAVLGEFL